MAASNPEFTNAQFIRLAKEVIDRLANDSSIDLDPDERSRQRLIIQRGLAIAESL